MEAQHPRALELHKQGQAHEAQGDLAGALALYGEASKIDLTNVPILRDLGRLALRMGELDRAQKCFRALLLQRLDGSAGVSKADAYSHLGDVCLRQGDAVKARAMLERALGADPQHAGALALMAQMHK